MSLDIVAEPAAGRLTLKLPPLILHPFADPSGPRKLVEGSRASMMLQGLLPSEGHSAAELDRILGDGRFAEIRMLFYVGRDLMRWIEQCVEVAERTEAWRNLGLQPQHFAHALIEHTPELVRSKLAGWGVTDYRSIFCRAIGLNAVFAEAPERELLAEEFLRNYYRYADHMFWAWRSVVDPAVAAQADFEFELYASGEYSRLLEREWN